MGSQSRSSSPNTHLLLLTKSQLSSQDSSDTNRMLSQWRFRIDFLIIVISLQSQSTKNELSSANFAKHDHKDEEYKVSKVGNQINTNKEVARASENEYKFPASNSVTEIDAKYFAMIQSEADWGNFTHQLQDEVPWMSQPLGNEVKIDSHGYPDSYSLTETDREYFNVIKTEDGQSRFFLTSEIDQVTESDVNKNKAQKQISDITDDRKSEET